MVQPFFEIIVKDIRITVTLFEMRATFPMTAFAKYLGVLNYQPSAITLLYSTYIYYKKF